jgi:hypothetical protein
MGENDDRVPVRMPKNVVRATNALQNPTVALEPPLDVAARRQH